MLIIFINFVFTLVLLEWLLKFYLVGSLPSYFVRSHFPSQHVHAIAEKIDARWTSNSQGFHDLERNFRKNEGVFRIVCIGDSFLDGPQQTPITIRLQEHLKTLVNHEIEVINLSRPGIDPYTYNLLLKHALKTYSPNLVINFIYAGNDFRNAEKYDFKKLTSEERQFYAAYPVGSFVSDYFPRISILIDGYVSGKLVEGAFINRYMEFPKHERWFPHETKDMDGISLEITKFIDAEPAEISKFLKTRLPEDELNLLTNHGVRVDLLAYFVGVGMSAEFRKPLNIKSIGRPELTSRPIEVTQAKSLFEFLIGSANLTGSRDVDYMAVVIPTSLIDKNAAEVYRLLRANDDPLFSEVRVRQEELLKTLLLSSDVKHVFLKDAFDGLGGTYLKYDSHWSDHGVQVAAGYLAPKIIQLADGLSEE